MNFFQVRQYTKFPHKDTKNDKLIKSFETLDQANEFSIAYNTQKDDKGNYIDLDSEGYYVCVIKNPEF